MDCCIKDFGLYPHNEDVVLHGFYVDTDGDYKVLVDLPGGNKLPIIVSLEAGDEITIPKMTLNESSVINFQVIDPWGNVLPFVDSYADVDCANMTLKTYVNQNVACSECDEDAEEETYY